MNTEFTKFLSSICETEPALHEAILGGYAICEADNSDMLTAITQELTAAQDDKAKSDEEYQKKVNDALQLMAKFGANSGTTTNNTTTNTATSTAATNTATTNTANAAAQQNTNQQVTAST